MNSFLKRNLANIVTLSRIPLALGMLFYPVFSFKYYIFFTLAGLTDAIDGPIARKMGTAGKLGAQIDSVADLTFFIIALSKMVPFAIENLNLAASIILILVLILRLFCYTTEAIKFKRLVSLHTWLNKATTVSMFIVIYLIPFIGISIPCIIGCVFALLAVIEEIAIVFTISDPKTDTHTILHA